MTETKYMMSSGIAFAEEQDLRKLRKHAANGWIAKRFKNVGYELERGPAEDAIFTIDVRELSGKDADEYIEMFAVAGWTHVSSNNELHLFKAAPGTKPIYTDRNTKLEKVQRIRQMVLPTTLISGLLLVIGYIVQQLDLGVVSNVASVLFFGMLVLFIPMFMTLVATFYQTYRVKNDGQ